MRGDYSPTVTAAYVKDQNWFRKYANLAPHGDVVYSPYDPDGFDSYGYDKDDIDRAGYTADAYYHNDADWDSDENYNNTYDAILGSWTFDGIKPVQIK